jgi:hypothetical protein
MIASGKEKRQTLLGENQMDRCVPGQSTWPQNRPLDVNLALLVSRNTPFIR